MSPERGRGKRSKTSRPPLRYQDYVDPSLIELEDGDPIEIDEPSEALPTTDSNGHPLPPHGFRQPAQTSLRDEFGLYKRYRTPEDHPYDPDATLHARCSHPDTSSLDPPPHTDNYYPFPNRNAFLLGEWRASDGNGKGRADFARLLEIISSPDWQAADVRGVNWAKIDNTLSEPILNDDLDNNWADESGWKTSTATISVPFTNACAKPGPHPYEVEFRHRPIVPMVREKLMNLTHSDTFHFLPYELRWHPGKTKADVKVHGELYTSDAFLKAFQDLQVWSPSHSGPRTEDGSKESPPEPGCNLPRYVVGLMFGSDETALAQFGTAKLWPLYMSYANDSKYDRAKIGLCLVEHLAYLSKVSISLTSHCRESHRYSFIAP